MGKLKEKIVEVVKGGGTKYNNIQEAPETILYAKWIEEV